MSAVTQIFNMFKQNAHILEQQEGIKYDDVPAKDTIEKMLNGYCLAKDSGDERKKDLYISGLMLRFWFVIGKLKQKCPGINLQTEDFISWLYESIEYACKYRAWQKNSKINAQQCVNQCIETIRKQHYYEFNLDKNRANYCVVSMDSTVSEDSNFSLGDTLEDENSTQEIRKVESDNSVRMLIQSYLNDNKIIEAMILDTIAYGETERIVKTTNKYIDDLGKERKAIKVTKEFWPFKVVQTLANINDDYNTYFKSKYEIKPEVVDIAVKAIKKANRSKLYKYLDKTLEDARKKLSVAL